MSEQTAELSPRMKARIAGIFYLLTILISSFAFGVHGPLRSVMLLSSTACYVAVTVLFYALFRPVNRAISALAAVFSLIGCALSMLDLFHLGSADDLAFVIDPDGNNMEAVFREPQISRRQR